MVRGMAVWNVAVVSCKGQEQSLWEQPFWFQHSGWLIAVGGRGPAHLTSRNKTLATYGATMCTAVGGSDGRCRHEELWQQFFLDPTLWLDNRQHKKSVHLPDFRHRETQEVLWLSSLNKPAWVDGELAALDIQMGLPLGPAGCDMGVTSETVASLCDGGQLREAVEALGVLVHRDAHVSKSLFYRVLKRCVGETGLVLGRRVHALVVKKGCETDTFLCNHILRMYASHAKLEEAMDVFNMAAHPDAFLWSSIMSALVKDGQDSQAVKLYHRMRTSSVKADGHVFVAALQACARGGDLESGVQVHADMLASGIEPDLFVGSCLVDMYARCGSLEDAQRVFDGLSQKNVVTWSTLIAGYAQQGMGQEALCLYRTMQEEGVAPNSVTFVCLLQACASVGVAALEEGKQLHVQIRERGLEADVVVGGSLVNMYAKCGSLKVARDVFEGLGQKNVVTWNAMIAGYSQQGMGQEALGLYRVMQEEGMGPPDAVTLVSLLQACASVGTSALETGKELHAQIRERGLQADVVVSGSLVNMYAKCGSLGQARSLFDGLGQKSAVTWNAMIAGYSKQGMGQEAFLLYSAMQEEDIIGPDSVTFVCLLQACASVGTPALEKGKQLDAQIRERGLQVDVAVSGSLVNMYAKCGSLSDARAVFDALDKKNVVTWSAMIAGYSQQGMGQDALGLYRAMQEEGVVAIDSVTFVSLLQACASVGAVALEEGKQLHGQIRELGLQADVVVGGSLVNMYAKCGSLEDALEVFEGLREKNVVTWNAMISAYCQGGMGLEALRLHTAMQEEGVVFSDPVTFVCLLQACASVGKQALEKGKQLHAQIRELELQADGFVVSSLVDMYAKCGSPENARDVFDGLDSKSVVTWNAMIAGYSQQGMGHEALRLYCAMENEGIAAPDSVTFVCLLQACAGMGNPGLESGKQLHAHIRQQGLEADEFVAGSLVNMYSKCGSLEDAQSLFDGLGQKNVVTWNSMITGYCQQGMGQQALGLYRTMQEEGIATPNSVTFICLLQACASVSALHLGRQLHANIKAEGLQADMLVAGSLIDMYGKCGSMVDARQVFDALPERDVVTWSALISGYTRQGESEEVFELVLRMTQDGIEPDGITYLSLLTVCSHRGLVNKGQEYFEAMSKCHGITPTLEHYTCMVDLLGRAGHLNEALALVRSMSVPPNAAIWHALLGSCQKWSDAEVGSHAFHEALKLNKKDAAAYVLMANIYTSAQMWQEALEVQSRRIQIGAWKQPGQSWWTDMDGLVHTFLVGNKRQPGLRQG